MTHCRYISWQRGHGMGGAGGHAMEGKAKGRPCEEDGELQVVGCTPALRFGLRRGQAAGAPLCDARLQVSIR